MHVKPLIAAFMAVFLLSSVIALAETPVKQVALQGRLSDPSGKPLDGSFSVKFEIFASPTYGATGTGLWSEAQKVTVTKGLFGVNLGSVTPLNLAFDKPYWVEVSIGAEKLSPRYPLTSAPYSFYSGVPGLDASKIISGTFAADRIPALTAAQIPGLDAAKIISGTLASARIPALTAAQIPALDASKIATGTLSADRVPMLDANKKIATGTITEPQIDHNAGLSAEILMHGALNPDRVPPLYKASWTATGAGRIDASFIGTGTYNNWVAGMPASMLTGALPIGLLPSTWPGTVDASKIVGLTTAMLPTITGDKIADGAITSAKIKDYVATDAQSGVRTADIADSAVTSAKIQDDSITTNDIKDHSIQGPDIIAHTIGAGELANGAALTNIVARGITNDKMAKRYAAGSYDFAGGSDIQTAATISDPQLISGICACSVASISGTQTYHSWDYYCNCFTEGSGNDRLVKVMPRYRSGSQVQSGVTLGINWIIVEIT
jgi:hypothetical protein